MNPVKTALIAALITCSVALAQYSKVWEQEIYDPQRTYLIGIAQTDSDPASEVVFIDNQSRTDQTQIVRILDAVTGIEEWSSDQFYFIQTAAPNQPRLLDVDNDGRSELLMLVEDEPGHALWTLYRFQGGPYGRSTLGAAGAKPERRQETGKPK
jgi:hypothetical protein